MRRTSRLFAAFLVFGAGCVDSGVAPQCFDLDDCPEEHLCIERECIPERLVRVDATARDDAEPVLDSTTHRDADEPIDARAEVDLGAPDAATPSDAQPQDALVPCGAELCDGVDNDCDGVIDEGFPVGEPCLVGVGNCQRQGVFECVNDGAACNAVPGTPADGDPCNGHDDDCDGAVDEGCMCQGGDIRPCGTDVGECVAGTQLCSDSAWGPCDATGPEVELCDLLDNDCDDVTDDAVDCSSILDGGAQGAMTACRGGSCLADCDFGYFDTNANVLDGCERGCPERGAAPVLHPAVPYEVAPDDIAVATDAARNRWVAWVDPAGAVVDENGPLAADRVRLFNPLDGATSTPFPPQVDRQYDRPALTIAQDWSYLAVRELGPLGCQCILLSMTPLNPGADARMLAVEGLSEPSPPTLVRDFENIAYMVFSTTNPAERRDIYVLVLDDGAALGEAIPLHEGVSEFPFVAAADAFGSLVVVVQEVAALEEGRDQELLAILYNVLSMDPVSIQEGWRLPWELGGWPNRAAAFTLWADELLLAAHVAAELGGSRIKVPRLFYWPFAGGAEVWGEASAVAPGEIPTSFGLTWSDAGPIVIHNAGSDLQAHFYGELDEDGGYGLGPALPVADVQATVRAAVALPGPSVFWLGQASFYTADLADCH